MKTISFDCSAAGFSEDEIESVARRLLPYMADLDIVLKTGNWSHPAASILLPSSDEFATQSLALVKFLPKPSLIVVVGIGGSNLGALAVSQAVLGTHHNLLSKPQILFADSPDAPSVHSIIEIARSHLKSGGHVVLNVISKSGTTLETIANFSAICSALSKGKKDHVHVVATSDAGSALERWARANAHPTLSIPKMVGGRFSVFSNVALFPLALAGVDIRALLSGAKRMRAQCLSKKIGHNPAMRMAAILYLHHQTGRRIHDHFFFSSDLAGLGLWGRQLQAESIGKGEHLDGSPARVGLTPTVSIGSTDLHSMAQLYLAGPSDKFFRLLAVRKAPHDISLPRDGMLDSLVPSASGRTLSSILSAIYGAVGATWRAKSIPLVSVGLPDLSAESVGMLMQEEMMEAIFLAKLLEVNAFDQPAVELYKKELRKLLS